MKPKGVSVFTRTDFEAATHELINSSDVNFGSVYKTVFVSLFILVLGVVTVWICG